MAKQQQQRQPGEGLSDDEQASLVHLGKMMGDPRDDFDREVEQHLHEMGYGKMHQAQMGLAPEPIEQAGEQQAAKLQQKAAAASQMQASQAQAQQTPVNAPPAPTGPQGATQPYPSQRQSQQAPQAPGEGEEG